jgi:hypothetical protein
LSFTAVLSPLLFSLAFFVLLPILGLDMERFGEPLHVLEVFGNNALLMRFIGINNFALMFCAGIVAVLLPRYLSGPSSEIHWIAGGINAFGWALYLCGELFDFTAYISLPNTALTAPDIAAQSFLTLQRTYVSYICLSLYWFGNGWACRKYASWQ